jgi:hypothetical protein
VFLVSVFSSFRILGFIAPISVNLWRGFLVDLIEFLYWRRHLEERWEAEEPYLLNQIECFIEVSIW